MLGRERVFAALQHREADRVPLYIWLFWSPINEAIRARYGSEAAFYDHFNIDMWQTFPGKGVFQQAKVSADMPDALDAERQAESDRLAELEELEPAGAPSRRNIYGNVPTLDEILELPLTDPDDPDLYTPIKEDIAFHKGQRGRAIFVQTPGVFECGNGIIGLQQCLEYMILEPEKLKLFFERLARWAQRYVDNCLDLGCDVIHVSDDWGMNKKLLFNPSLWWEIVYPAERLITEHAVRRGAIVSLHSDGDIWDLMDGIIQLGIRCVHPVQESAGMDMLKVKRTYGDILTIYGGLDVRETLGREEQDLNAVRDEIVRNMRNLKPGGGFIFCTSHIAMEDTPLSEIEFALEVANEHAWYKK